MASKGGRPVSVLSAPLASQSSSKSGSLAALFSPKTAKQRALPKFLREPLVLSVEAGTFTRRLADTEARLHGAEELAMLSASLGTFQGKPLLHSGDYTERLTTVSKSVKAQREAEQRQIIEAVVRGEFSSSPALWIDGEAFSCNDLSPLVLGQDPSRKVMQAFFKYLNRGNKTLRGVDRVKILSIALVSEVLTRRKGGDPHMHCNPLKYE